jgi:hypothetical protein
MTTPAKIVNLDALGYALVTESGLGIAQAEKSLTGNGSSVELTAGLANRTKLYVKVLDGEGDVYVGDDNVSTSTGYLMKAKDELWLDVGPDVAVHAIAGASDSKVRVLETSQGTYTYPAQSAGHPSKVVNLDTHGHAAVTQAGSSVKAAAVSVDSTTTRKTLTAGLANRRKLYIKLIGDDVNGQRFIYVAEFPSLGPGPPHTSEGYPVWARYEAVLEVGAQNELYAIMSATGDALDVRVLEIG